MHATLLDVPNRFFTYLLTYLSTSSPHLPWLCSGPVWQLISPISPIPPRDCEVPAVAVTLVAVDALLVCVTYLLTYLFHPEQLQRQDPRKIPEDGRRSMLSVSSCAPGRSVSTVLYRWLFARCTRSCVERSLATRDCWRWWVMADPSYLPFTGRVAVAIACCSM